MNTYPLIAAQKAGARRKPEHRFCADCVHHVETRVMFIVPDHLCGHPSVCHPVTRQALTRCDDMRHAKGKCGERAKLFDAVDLVRMPEPPRLLNGARIRELFARHIAEARA